MRTWGRSTERSCTFFISRTPQKRTWREDGRAVTQRPREVAAGVAQVWESRPCQPENHRMFFQERMGQLLVAPSDQLRLLPTPQVPWHSAGMIAMHQCPLVPKNNPVLPGPIPPLGIYSALAGCWQEQGRSGWHRVGRGEGALEAQTQGPTTQIERWLDIGRGKENERCHTMTSLERLSLF